ncbi:endonuclease [Neptuniibacter sp. QD37_11]|uniref:endonuclease n=1 Tax=Neptuniibacter sp. QD37_11 TaxID=3398209 RepID=UPI0039F51219
MNKLEWEHVVPAENFGRAFSEWREGHPECVTSKGKTYKGRRCAEKVNVTYKYMQADLHNIFAAVGSVNAQRLNYKFTELPSAEVDFGTCAMKIDNKQAEPPIGARGRIARAHLYMDDAYKIFKLSSQQRKLMEAWDKMYPVSAWECTRNVRILQIQGNSNPYVTQRCVN